jgi:enoyl-CoA hydratase/carnithine racemase
MTFLDEFRPTRLRVTAQSPTLWQVTFDNPPVNVIGPDLMRDLKELLTELESNQTVNVVVFDSADADFYLAHYDLDADPQVAEALPSPTGYAAWVDITVRISKLCAVTISAIRGIARGAGSEFVLATDIRFASREKAVLGQMEVGFGAVPGGGAAGRLPALVGRGRAFEILLGGADFDGDTAERYGYVNRAVTDADFVAFVHDYATRVSRWDHQALGEIKAFINKYTRLPDSEFPLHSDAFWAAAHRDRFQLVSKALFANGLQQRTPLEYHLGADIADIIQSARSAT